MAGVIQQNNIQGFSVYGQQQVDYTVQGMPHQDFAAAVASAALGRTLSLESATSSLVAGVRLRMRKLDDLGQCMSVVSKYVATLADEDTTDTASGEDLLKTKNLLEIYGIEGAENIDQDGSKGKINKGDLSELQAQIQYAMDREDNDLQQDMTAVQSYVSKRDQGYQTAYAVVRKVLRSASSTINNIGR